MQSNMFASIRKIASIVLAICFVLPLSQCTTPIEHQGRMLATDTQLHGFDLVRDGLAAIWRGDAKGALLLPAVAIVFFVPVLCLRLREQRQALIHFIGALVSAYCLFVWVFVFATRPRIGGLLAASCWGVLFCIGGATLSRRWRGGFNAGIANRTPEE
jgi:hypothetical protein